MDIQFQKISDAIKVVKDFPKQGIYFRDVSPLLKNAELRDICFRLLSTLVNNIKIDYIAGIESRGFIFGMGLAQILGAKFIMLRKPNKMPDTIQASYDLEYGKDTLTIQKDAIEINSNVLVVDDLCGTGGTFCVACNLIEQLGGNVVGCLCLIELTDIDRNKKLNDYKLFSLLKYSAHSDSTIVPMCSENILVNKTRIEYLPTDNFILNDNDNTDNRIVVFAHPSMKSIAQNIINTSIHYRTGIITWNHFPDDYPNIRFEHLNYLENKRVIFIGSLYNQKYLLEQLSTILVLPRQFIKSLDIIIPYFAPATMERVDEEGILATAETTAKILSSCLFTTQQGLPILHIYDLHALPIRHYFSDNVIVRMETAIPLLKQKITKNTTIVFPDEGAAKRFTPIFSEYKIIVCSKVREFDKRIIKIVDKLNWPLDDSKCLDDVLIVDDLVQSGGTLDECRKALKNLGAKQISAYVTHAVFPNKNYTKFFNSEFHKFYVTNSIPEIASILDGVKPFEVLKIDQLLLNTLNKSYEISDNTHKTTQLTIYVASSNKHKLKAVHDAFLSHYDKINGKYTTKLTVYGIDVLSDVSPQPINDETLQGCKNRLNNLKKYITYHKYQYDYIVSIESGISYTSQNDSDVYDFCYTCVMNKDESTFLEISDDKTYFPAKYVIQSIQSNKMTTASSIIEKEFGVKTGSWHQLYCDFTRIDMMRNNVLKCIKNIIC